MEERTMTSTKPYLLRALYEWIVDNEMTPHILIDAEQKNVRVPRQYVKDGQVILNISPGAVRDLNIDNDWFSFNTRFGGTPFPVGFPITAVLGIFTKESNQGMFFEPEEESELSKSKDDEPIPPRPPRGKPVLKRVK